MLWVFLSFFPSLPTPSLPFAPFCLLLIVFILPGQRSKGERIKFIEYVLYANCFLQTLFLLSRIMIFQDR